MERIKEIFLLFSPGGSRLGMGRVRSRIGFGLSGMSQSRGTDTWRFLGKSSFPPDPGTRLSFPAGLSRNPGAVRLGKDLQADPTPTCREQGQFPLSRVILGAGDRRTPPALIPQGAPRDPREHLRDFFGCR